MPTEAANIQTTEKQAISQKLPTLAVATLETPGEQSTLKDVTVLLESTSHLQATHLATLSLPTHKQSSAPVNLQSTSIEPMTPEKITAPSPAPKTQAVTVEHQSEELEAETDHGATLVVTSNKAVTPTKKQLISSEGKLWNKFI